MGDVPIYPTKKVALEKTLGVPLVWGEWIGRGRGGRHEESHHAAIDGTAMPISPKKQQLDDRTCAFARWKIIGNEHAHLPIAKQLGMSMPGWKTKKQLDVRRGACQFTWREKAGTGMTIFMARKQSVLDMPICKATKISALTS